MMVGPKKESSLSHKVPMTKPMDAWFSIDSIRGRDGQVSADERLRNPSALSQPLVGGLVEPGKTAMIEEESYAMFRAERLFVHRSCASDFLITHVLVGARFAGMAHPFNPIIAEPFAVDYDALTSIKWAEASKQGQPIKITVDRKAIEFLGAPFVLPTLPPHLKLHFGVENIGKEPRRFMAAFYGKAVW